jgi:hypothetical protein
MNDDPHGIGQTDCMICMGRGRIMVGMSFPPNKTIAVKYEYEPCPACKLGPHSFYARRRMQMIKDGNERRATLAELKGEKDE